MAFDKTRSVHITHLNESRCQVLPTLTAHPMERDSGGGRESALHHGGGAADCTSNDAIDLNQRGDRSGLHYPEKRDAMKEPSPVCTW